MWPFAKKVRPYAATEPADRILIRGVKSNNLGDSLGKVYDTLCESLKKRLDVGYLSPFKQEQNVRDISDITKRLAYWARFYEEAPEVFSRENALRIAGLIRRASEYVQGTEYETIVSDRKRMFLENVITGRRRYEAWKPVRVLLEGNVA